MLRAKHRTKIILFIIANGWFCCFAFGQSLKIITLQDCILLAQGKSPKYKLVQTRSEVSKYQYQVFKTESRPQISFYGTVPVYSKVYNPITQPDGTVKFIPIQQNYSSAGLSLAQQISSTGGTVSINTDLSHFYDFQSKFSQFNGTPVFVRLNQPLFAYNDFKWRKLIEPLKLEEARRDSVQQMEAIAQDIISIYFDILNAQDDENISTNNMISTQINFEIEKKRINLGTTTEDRLLQLEIQVLKSKQAVETSKYALKVAELKLRTYLGELPETGVAYAIPVVYPVMDINLKEAIEFAKKARPEFIAFERKKLETQRDVSQANSAGKEISISASYGFNNAAENLGGVYISPKDQQRFSMTLNVPLVDWGRKKARVNAAISMKKLADYNNDFDEKAIGEEIITTVNNLELLKNNIVLSKITDSVASRRYTLANSLYQLGKLTISELNLAQNEKDNARRSRTSSLRSYWNAVYTIRRLTMFDFENRTSLVN